MALPHLPQRKKKLTKDKPRDARDKFLKQLKLRESDDRQRTQQELLLVRASGSLELSSSSIAHSHTRSYLC